MKKENYTHTRTHTHTYTHKHVQVISNDIQDKQTADKQTTYMTSLHAFLFVNNIVLHCQENKK